MKNRNTALRGRTMFGNEYVCEEQIPSTLIVMDLKGRGRFRMAETALDNGHEIWKRFLRKHWRMLVLFVTHPTDTGQRALGLTNRRELSTYDD